MFRTPHPNITQSDSGFSVEVLGRTGLKYTELQRSMMLDSELLAGPEVLVLYTYSIEKWLPPHDAEPLDQNDKDRIVENIREAFRFRGWEIAVQ